MTEQNIKEQIVKKEIAKELENLRAQVKPVSRKAADAAAAHWDQIAKPLDGLGRFEKMVIKIAAMTGKPEVILDKKAVIAMCADNGIVEEKVTQTDSSVTAAVAESMAKGTANVCRMAACVGARVFPVDIGIKDGREIAGLFSRRAANGTGNFLKEPAMSGEELLHAIKTGVEMAEYCGKQQIKMIATGEMGIGNTTTSTAVACAMLSLEPEEVTGRGAGLDDAGLERKVRVIRQGLEKYELNQTETFEILRTFGGLDLAGLTGVFLGGAIYRIPVVIDGVISAVAALAAERLFPGCKNFMLASHMGREKAMQAILTELQTEPVIYGDLALGEGSGAVMLFPLLDQTLAVYNGNTTFDDISVRSYERFGTEENQE